MDRMIYCGVLVGLVVAVAFGAAWLRFRLRSMRRELDLIRSLKGARTDEKGT